MSEFVHLHVHSHYSVLDGISKLKELCKKTASFGQKAIALTDHGNMFGAMEFYKECKGAGIKPIYGSELYVAPRSRYEQDKTQKYYHLVCLAEDMDGYRNLLKLTSIGYQEGFYSKPRVDKDALREHSKGLIVLSACLGGEIPQMIMNGNDEGLKKAIGDYIDIFGTDRFFLEIQNNGIPEQAGVNRALIQLSKETGLGLVATNDVHYIEPSDAKLQEIAFCVRDKTTLSDPKRQQFGSSEFYLKSPEQMCREFAEVPEAIENTLKIAERCHCEVQNNFCDVKKKLNMHTPLYPLPEGETAHSYLIQLCKKGLAERFRKQSVPQDYAERLDQELVLIDQMGFSNYFLIVSDYVRWAKDNGVLVGPGRGSAAGALLAYSLGITNVDPVQYQLLFERFLNPERVSMPDIDVDFQDDRRDEVKEYIRAKYGYNRTSDIITFGVMGARAALKDVGRVLDIPLEVVNRTTKFIDNKQASEALSTLIYGKETEKEKIAPIPELKQMADKASSAEKEWFEYAIKLDGTIRNLGTHASGLIISDIELTDVVPLYRDNRSGLVATQFEGSYLEQNGLLKMDILGLSNLTMIHDCLDRIRRNHCLKLDIFNVPLDDQEVFKLFWDGETGGIFQFESGGMTEYLKQLKPTCIDDLIAMNALYRPGPMDNIPSFIARKQGNEAVNCYHESLVPILQSTYGIMVYQEQVMQIAQVLAGFSLGKADNVRRIMAKKKPEELEKIRPEWIEGAVSRGYTRELAEELFAILVPFSNYAFNKSHAAAYGILAYQIAYLKVHYRIEFLASLLTLNMSDSAMVKLYCQEAGASGVRVLSPDINRSRYEFVEVPGAQPAILFGFGAIKGLGEGFSMALVAEREEGGPFISFDDFVRRMMKQAEFKKSAVLLMIQAGCFDFLFPEETYLQEKAVLLANAEAMIDSAMKSDKEAAKGQLGLFGDDSGMQEAVVRRNVPPLSLKQEFENELSVFGFYLSGRLFDHYTRQFGRVSVCGSELLMKLKPGIGSLVTGFIQEVTVKISDKRPYPGPNGFRKDAPKENKFAIFTLDNGQELFKFFLFSEKYEQFGPYLVQNSFVLMRLMVSEGRRGKQLDVMSMKPIEALPSERFTQLHVCLDASHPEVEQTLSELKEIVARPGQNRSVQLMLHILQNGELQSMAASDRFRLDYSQALLNRLEQLAGVRGFWLY